MAQHRTAPPAPSPPIGLLSAAKGWAQGHRAELLVFAVSLLVLAMFSGPRFLRQSAAPHFVYQAQAWLDGRLDIDAEVLPNLEDWACVRTAGTHPQRCTPPAQSGDRWYNSFPPFPSLAMLPFVALNGYQLNDTSFGVIVAALALALFYALLRSLAAPSTSLGVSDTGQSLGGQQLALTALLGCGTLFFSCAIRGEVWFSAEVMGVALTAGYVHCAIQARRPALAGLFFSMAVLTRTPLLFTGVFFLLEALCPTPGQRLEELRAFARAPLSHLAPLRRFGLGALPLAVLAAVHNWVRFGSLTEFGHRFLYNNRVNADIDATGLFSLSYLARNLDAAFLKLPGFHNGLSYDPWGLSLFLTLPLLALVFASPRKPSELYTTLSAMAAVLVASALSPAGAVGARPTLAWVVLVGALAFLVRGAVRQAVDKDGPRLFAPLVVTAAACALPGLFYQNTGYAQFGFRFSLDYTPYLVLAVAVSGWNLKKPLPLALALLSVAVNFWGAVAFRGYTELVYQWRW